MKNKGNIMEEELNEIQLIHALVAMRHLDIITDTDVKCFIASDDNKITQEFYDYVQVAINKGDAVAFLDLSYSIGLHTTTMIEIVQYISQNGIKWPKNK